MFINQYKSNHKPYTNETWQMRTTATAEDIRTLWAEAPISYEGQLSTFIRGKGSDIYQRVVHLAKQLDARGWGVVIESTEK